MKSTMIILISTLSFFATNLYAEAWLCLKDQTFGSRSGDECRPIYLHDWHKSKIDENNLTLTIEGLHYHGGTWAGRQMYLEDLYITGTPTCRVQFNNRVDFYTTAYEILRAANSKDEVLVVNCKHGKFAEYITRNFDTVVIAVLITQDRLQIDYL